MFRIKCDLQIRGDEWGVSLGAGRIVSSLTEDLGDGKTLEALIEEGCINDGHFEPFDASPAAQSFTGLPADEEL
jgi:hypothetical protein